MLAILRRPTRESTVKVGQAVRLVHLVLDVARWLDVFRDSRGENLHLMQLDVKAGTREGVGCGSYSDRVIASQATGL